MGNDGESTRERIMEATYDALAERGYAAVTMSDIAERSETSTSLLHYHFDTKEDLLIAFLEHLLENIERDIHRADEPDPLAKLHDILEWYVIDPDEDRREAFHVALLELRMQASRHDRYRSRVREADRLIRDGLADAIADAIEAEQFAETDPDATAALLLSAADGAHTRLLMTGETAYTDVVSGPLTKHVLDDLLTPAGAARWRDLTEEE